MTNWKYYNFYFGNALWPSEMTWREDPETGARQLLMEGGVGRADMDVIRQEWELAQKHSEVYDPVVHTWTTNDGKVLHSLGYWEALDSEREKEAWEFSLRAQIGLEKIPRELDGEWNSSGYWAPYTEE